MWSIYVYIEIMKKIISIISLLFFVFFLKGQNHSKLSDNFTASASLDDWKRFYQNEGWPDMMKRLWIEEGFLYLEPYTSGWYADYHAPFLFKEIKGDFVVRTRLLVSGLKDVSPKATWSLSGLMVRAPRDVNPKNWAPKGENWIFLTTGIADNIQQPVFETKSTINSKSKLKLHPNRLDWVELKIIREGARFTLWYKYEGESWNKIEEFFRPDLPSKLQVGLNAYTDFYSAGKSLMGDLLKYNTTVVKYGKPDLLVKVDYVIFE